jgi:hypothetical protein
MSHAEIDNFGRKVYSIVENDMQRKTKNVPITCSSPKKHKSLFFFLHPSMKAGNRVLYAPGFIIFSLKGGKFERSRGSRKLSKGK